MSFIVCVILKVTFHLYTYFTCNFPTWHSWQLIAQFFCSLASLQYDIYYWTQLILCQCSLRSRNNNLNLRKAVSCENMKYSMIYNIFGLSAAQNRAIWFTFWKSCGAYFVYVHTHTEYWISLKWEREKGKGECEGKAEPWHAFLIHNSWNNTRNERGKAKMFYTQTVREI